MLWRTKDNDLTLGKKGVGHSSTGDEVQGAGFWEKEIQKEVEMMLHATHLKTGDNSLRELFCSTPLYFSMSLLSLCSTPILTYLSDLKLNSKETYSSWVEYVAGTKLLSLAWFQVKIDIPWSGTLGVPRVPYPTPPYPNDLKKLLYPTRELLGRVG